MRVKIGENVNAFVKNVADAQEIRVIIDNDATESEIEEVNKKYPYIDFDTTKEDYLVKFKTHSRRI